jgi:hypothetical protein
MGKRRSNMHHQAFGLYRGKMKIPSLNVMFALEKEATSTEHLYYHVEIHSQLLSHSGYTAFFMHSCSCSSRCQSSCRRRYPMVGLGEKCQRQPRSGVGEMLLLVSAP